MFPTAPESCPPTTLPITTSYFKVSIIRVKIVFKLNIPHKDRTKTAETPYKVIFRQGVGRDLAGRKAGLGDWVFWRLAS
jgi:hypothetical protein